jgi:hypothetical protein
MTAPTICRAPIVVIAETPVSNSIRLDDRLLNPSPCNLERIKFDPAELRVLADLTVELIKLRQLACPQTAVEIVGPDIYKRLFDSIYMHPAFVVSSDPPASGREWILMIHEPTGAIMNYMPRAKYDDVAEEIARQENLTPVIVREIG